MSDYIVPLLIVLVALVLVSVLFDILFRWIDEFISYKKDGKRISFTIIPRGSGESNASRGWK